MERSTLTATAPTLIGSLTLTAFWAQVPRWIGLMKGIDK